MTTKMTKAELELAYNQLLVHSKEADELLSVAEEKMIGAACIGSFITTLVLLTIQHL